MPEIWFPNLGIKISNLSKIAFTIGDYNIYWYGIIIGAAIIAAFFLVLHEAKRTGQSQNDYIDFASFTIILSIIGARLYYVIFSWDYYSKNPIKIFAIHEGGLAIYGAILTGIICGIVFSKIKKLNFFLMLDTIIPSVLLGQICGRWGNFFNREAFGGYTDCIFAMRYLKSQVTNIPQSVAEHIVNIGGTEYIQVHPTFFYESFLNLCLFVFLIILRKHKRFNGQIGALYLIGYGVIRFFVESMRTDQLIIGSSGIPVSQVVSAVIFILGIIMYIALPKLIKSK